MSNAARRAVLDEQLKSLKMPSVQRDYEERARQARDGEWDYEDYLRELVEAEVRDRSARAAQRRLKEAHFPDHKTLEQIDWKALTGVSKPKINELASGDYIDRGDDVVLVGPIGTGKTHLAIALGVEAAQRRRRVWFRKASDLVRDLLEARDQRELGRLQRKLQRIDLLICDELGFVPFDRAGGELLFNVFADRYEQRSTIVTSNLAFSEWVRVFGDEKLTTALLDRLSHHAHILTTRGKSYRRHSRSKTT
jgi:DNA replication protein DnaC